MVFILGTAPQPHFFARRDNSPSYFFQATKNGYCSLLFAYFRRHFHAQRRVESKAVLPFKLHHKRVYKHMGLFFAAVDFGLDSSFAYNNPSQDLFYKHKKPKKKQ